jgi:hypothetical protein
MDAGQNLTEAVIKNGSNINYWWPTHIEVEEWALYHPVHTKFGHGTTYNDAMYHAFQSTLPGSPVAELPAQKFSEGKITAAPLKAGYVFKPPIIK